MNKFIALLFVLVVACAPASYVDAKGGGGGGGRGGGFSRGASRASAPSRATVTKPSVPAAPKVTSRPSATTQTVSSSKAVVSSTGKKMSGKGSVVDSTYQPRFSGGYVPPAGSVVYYRESSMLDWLPLYLILTHDSHREAVVVTPDGKEQTIKEEGVDTMYVINWIMTILLGLGIVALIVWFVNKKTQKKKKQYDF